MPKPKYFKVSYINDHETESKAFSKSINKSKLGISEPEFYGDLVYRFRKIVGKSNFSEQFRKLINR